jgi:hypothetical protein
MNDARLWMVEAQKHAGRSPFQLRFDQCRALQLQRLYLFDTPQLLVYVQRTMSTRLLDIRKRIVKTVYHRNLLRAPTANGNIDQCILDDRPDHQKNIRHDCIFSETSVSTDSSMGQLADPRPDRLLPIVVVANT